MGGASSAVGSSTASLFGNPANLALARLYHFEGLAALAPEARRQSYGAAAVDSSTSRLAGGVGGTWNSLDPDGVRRTWTDIRLGLAMLLGERLSAGLTGRYLRIDQAIERGPFGASFVSDGRKDDPITNAITVDAGITAVPADFLRIGVVGHNLTNPGTALAPTLLEGGVGLMLGDVTIEGGGLVDFTTWGKAKSRFMLGAEVFLANHFPLRAGYRFDEGTNAHALTAGVGYVDKKFSIEISGRRDVVADRPMSLLSLGIRYFYDSARGAGTDEPD
jgi:hypothetical protein